MMRRDICYVAEQLYEVGCEAINLDTSASAGDADFWGCLSVVEDIKSKTARPAGGDGHGRRDGHGHAWAG